MVKYFSLILLFCFAYNPGIFGQARFSQFYASPLLFNPANTGRFNKSYRIGGSYRREINAQEQLSSQGSFFLDSKIFNKLTPQNDCFAIGVLGLSEKSSTEGVKNTYVSFSVAYHKGLDEEGKQQLGIGFQTTFARRQLQRPEYVFENQLVSWLNSGYSNIDISQLGNVDVTYTDLNAGLVYQGKINANNFLSAGISMYHITEPSRVFNGGELNVSRQTWSHLGWEIDLADSKKIYSAVLIGYSDRSVSDLFAGLNCQININRDYQFTLGGWFRKNILRGSSLIPTVGLNFYGFVLNTSYDINISSKNQDQKGASEISLIYTNAKTRERFSEDKFIKF